MLNSAARFLAPTAARFPDRTAVEDEWGSLTWKELEGAVERAASALLDLGAAAARPVLVYLPKSRESVVSFLAALYAGCPYAPVDYAIPPERLARTLENLRPAFVITDPEGLAHLSALDLCGAQAVLYTDLAAAEPDHDRVMAALDQVIDTDPCYIMYTSGSTGVPKGVAVPHRGVLEYAQAVVDTFGIDERSVLGLQSGFHFDNSVFDLYACLLTGAKLVIIPEILFMYPTKLMDLVGEKGVTCVFWVPTVMISVANSGALEGRDLPQLRTVVFAGEVMPNRQLNVWRRALPHCVYANLYGPTEITVDCTCYIVDRDFDDADPLPIGKPWRGARVLLLKEDDTPAAAGEEGEICVLGSGVALGYWNAPEQTAKAFVPNPLNPAYPEIMYRTGDLGKWDADGNILFCGRRDHQFKLRGNRIELGDIETAAATLEGVDKVCALFDQANQEIILAVESKVPLQLRRVNLALGRLIPKYMLPRRLEVMEALPLTPNRKIDRVALNRALIGGRGTP